MCRAKNCEFESRYDSKATSISLSIIITSMAFAIIVCFSGFASASNATSLTASVNVTCPFSITAKLTPIYNWGNIASLDYVATPTLPCSVSHADGHVYVYSESTNVLVFSSNMVTPELNYNYTTPGSVSFNTTSVSPGNYSVWFRLAALGNSASANGTIDIISQPLIKISGITVPSQVQMNSPLSIDSSFYNAGQMASNSFTLYVQISGPDENVTLPYNESGLSPNQSASVTLSIPGYTTMVGMYDAKVYAIFNSNGTRSNSASMGFEVVTSTSGSHSTVSNTSSMITSPVVLTPLTTLSVMYAPLSTSLPSSDIASTSFVLQNPGNFPVSVSLSVPPVYQNAVSLAFNSVNIYPKGSASPSLVFSSKNLSTGTYVVPVNITVYHGNTVLENKIQPLMFNVYANSQSLIGVTSQISFLNNGTVAQGNIVATAYAGIENATLQTIFPKSVAPSISDISAYGIPNNISEENNYYVITWDVGQVDKNESAVAYYQILSPSPMLVSMPIQTLLKHKSNPKPSSVLSRVNVLSPTIPKNSSGTVTVAALYTGTEVQDVYFYLTSGSGFAIANSTRVVEAKPNLLLTQNFTIFANSPLGFQMLYAYIRTNGSSLNYTIPVRVIPPTAETSSSNVVFRNILSVNEEYVLAMTASVLILLFLLSKIKKRLPYGLKTKKHREKKLLLMRENIKREMNEQ